MASATTTEPVDERAALVRRFLAAWDRRDPTELTSYFAEDAVYHNIPREPLMGKDAIHAHLRRILAGHDGMHFDVKPIVADGDTVVAERIDHLSAGDIAVALPVVGVFTVAGERITAWRDYFDPRPLEPLVEVLKQRQAWSDYRFS